MGMLSLWVGLFVKQKQKPGCFGLISHACAYSSISRESVFVHAEGEGWFVGRRSNHCEW